MGYDLFKKSVEKVKKPDQLGSQRVSLECSPAMSGRFRVDRLVDAK